MIGGRPWRIDPRIVQQIQSQVAAIHLCVHHTYVAPASARHLSIVTQVVSGGYTVEISRKDLSKRGRLGARKAMRQMLVLGAKSGQIYVSCYKGIFMPHIHALYSGTPNAFACLRLRL